MFETTSDQSDFTRHRSFFDTPYFYTPINPVQECAGFLFYDGPAKRCHHTPRGRRRVSAPAACSAQERTARRLGSPWAVFHAAGRWGPGFFCFTVSFGFAGIVFYLLFSPARFKPGRPHHLAGTPYRFHKAHDGFLHAFSPSPGACGRPLRARTCRRPRKALRLCAFIFCFERW